MRFRGTAVLFLLLAALAGWVYWTDIRGREEREQAAEAAALALPVEADAVVGISLVYPDRTITGTRTDDGWAFVSPEGLEAASAEWDRLAANVGRIERGEAIASENPDLAGFGLVPPALEVRVETSDGDEEAILFGDENPAGTDNYVKLDSAADVFLSPTSWLSLLSVELDTLRDKTVLGFDPDTIQRIEISTDGVSLQKQGTSWSLESPIRTAADDAVVRSFLSTLDSARATGFQEEPVSPGTPRLIVTLTSDSGEQHELRISGSNESGNASLDARQRHAP